MSIVIVLQLSGVCRYPNGTPFNYVQAESFNTNPEDSKSLQATYDYETTDGYGGIAYLTLEKARMSVKPYCYEEFDSMVELAEKSGMDITAILYC